MDNNTISPNTPSTPLTIQLSDAASAVLFVHYSLVAVTTLLVYEAILMFPEEFEYIYTKKVTLTSFFYGLTRYCSIAYFLTQVIIDLQAAQSTFFGGLAGEVLVVIAGFLALIGIQGLWGTRLYGVSGGNRLWTIFLVILFFLMVGIYIASPLVANLNKLTATGQYVLVTRALSILQVVLITLYDTMVFVGTLYYTIGSWRLQRQTSLDSTKSITKLLLEQGIARYLLVLISTVIALVFDFVPGISVAQDSLGSYLQSSLSAILLCRLTLDLRRRYEKRIDSVKIPSLTFSVRSVRDTGRYIHESLVAEGDASPFVRAESEDAQDDTRIPGSDSYPMV